MGHSRWVGLETIHNQELVHRDIHSGNILFFEDYDPSYQWQIGDLGLSQSLNNVSNNEIYGVMPYVAPEYQDASYANLSLNEYTSKELEFDISRQPAIDVKSTTQNASNTLHQKSEINSQVKGKRVKTGDNLISESLN
ncbi:12163_t:CDS:2 [Funneliformis geosporum]|uniref:12163_t:CDS:1 n=1 Tax=Funneliformis geosporum TaxID=1117311 RepID=A0A9W4SB40_9GLOM|nr:12163_t:CDS:2 [Funneliformis geosporum]